MWDGQAHPAFDLIGHPGRSNMTPLSLGGARRVPSAGKEEGQQVFCLSSTMFTKHHGR
jgi:hypothetical protein